MRKFLVFFLIPILFIISAVLMVKLDKSKPVRRSGLIVRKFKYETIELIPEPLRGVVADVLYMKTCVEIGSQDKKSLKDWENMVFNLHVVTKVDPYFFDAYYMMASYLPWKLEKDERQIKNINNYLKEGIKYIKDWRIPFFIGFNYFYFLKDKVQGAKYLEMASDMKGAPKYLKLLVPKLYAKSGRIELAIATTREELKNATDEELKKKLKKRLKALEIILYLDKAVEVYRKRYGKCPDSLKDLLKAGIIETIPEDPFGGNFYIKDKNTCSVWTSSNLVSKKKKK